MFCIRCGAKIREESCRYCSSCGADLSPQASSPDSSHRPDPVRQTGVQHSQTSMQETQNNILGVAVGGLAGAILPTKESKDNIRIAAPAEAVLKTVSGILKDAQCLTDEFPGSSPGLRLSVLVRSGFLKLNPTIIHVQVSRDSEASSTVSITAAAKEGLVNQHSAEKAIAWLKDALLLAYPSR